MLWYMTRRYWVCCFVSFSVSLGRVPSVGCSKESVVHMLVVLLLSSSFLFTRHRMSHFVNNCACLCLLGSLCEYVLVCVCVCVYNDLIC